jgi:hypothetical protein
VRKVVLIAITLAVLAVVADYLLAGGSFFGLLALIVGSIGAALMVGAGVILTLVGLTAIGAWLGGLGLMLEACILLAWWLLGAPWFP